MDSLCKIRDLQRAIIAFECEFQKILNISLNEGMALCTLKSAECLSSGQLAEQLGLSYSNTSKLIKTLEDKKFVSRCIGVEDKRQMLFSITQKGKEVIKKVKNTDLPLPQILAQTINEKVNCNDLKT